MNLLNHLYTFDAHSGREQRFTEEVIRLCRERGADDVRLDAVGNLYVTKGKSDTYPCIVAHLDEVHGNRGKNFEVVTDGDIIRGFNDKAHRSPHGIGADDKNGIWVALRCLESFESVKCAFFVGEEIGCVGSGRADMNFFKDCRFCIQCDRRNDSDLIVSVSGVQLCSKRFLKEIGYKEYGYSKTTGLMTDVYMLKRRGLKCSCVNMSCGYYNPHTSTEYTRFSHLQKCLKFVFHIVSSCTDVYPHDKRSEPKICYTYSFPSQTYKMSVSYPKCDFEDEFDYSDMYELVCNAIEENPDISDDKIHEDVELVFGKYDKSKVNEVISEVREYILTDACEELPF